MQVDHLQSFVVSLSSLDVVFHSAGVSKHLQLPLLCFIKSAIVQCLSTFPLTILLVTLSFQQTYNILL